MIYFIRSPEGPIKIGTTVALTKRLRQLVARNGAGLVVLGVLPGSYREERALHRKFKHLRTVGEWFKPGADLERFIRTAVRPWDGTDAEPGRRRRERAARWFAVEVAAGLGSLALLGLLAWLWMPVGQ